jgi:hypothetical protein
MAEKKILRLTCPVCETRLRVAEDIERFACLNCGTELLVEKEGGLVRLVPSEAVTSQMTDSQQQLIEVTTALKTADDNFGVGCAVVTMGITLVACIALSFSLLIQSQVLFWLTIVVALALLAVVLFLFTTASSRSTDPLLRQRDYLQSQVAQESATEPPDNDAPGVQPSAGA